MAKKAKSTKKKSNSKKITKPTKPTKTTPKPPVQSEVITVQAEVQQASAVPEPVIERVEAAPQSEPISPAVTGLVLTNHKKLAGMKVLAQIGRYVVHPARNVADELTITDSETGKVVANVHQSVPLPVITWICDCAGAIQANPKMDDIVKGHGMTNVKATCNSVTCLALSLYQGAQPVIQM